MKASVVRTIALKEFKCFFSSVRIASSTLLFALAIVPLMLLVGRIATDAQRTSPEALVVGAADSQTEEWLSIAPFGSVLFVAPDKANEALGDGRLDVYVERDSDAGTVLVRFSSAIPSSAAAASLLQSIDVQGAVELKDVSGVDARDVAAYSFLPAGLFVVASMSAGSLAAFASVRKRELGTMEPLLSTGVTQLEVALGKYVAVLAGSAFSTAIGVASALIGMHVLAPTAGKLEFMSVCAVSMSCMMATGLYAALFLAIGFASENQREAQSYIGIISTFSMAPSLFFTSARIGTAADWALIPVLSGSAIIRDALYGEVNVQGLALTSGITMLLVIVLLVISTRFIVIDRQARVSRPSLRWR